LPIDRVAEMTDLNDAERLMSALRLVSTAEQRHAKAISRRLSMNAGDLNALSGTRGRRCCQIDIELDVFK
jgi:hypothetical protein